MACSKCGSLRNCNCGCSAVPYYQQTPVCEEDHCLKVYQPQFNFSVCPTSSWNVPLCGQTAILEVPGLQGATVGSFLWHPQFGYFKINSVDAVNGLLGITNTCVEGNASAGAQIPACTCFIVTDPPVDTSLTGVCVDIDFTAPEVDVPLDIILTSTIGLTVGDTVQIGTGFYLLSAIKPDNVVTIVNKGEGITPGTPVIARDAEGNPLFCLSVVSTNPCAVAVEKEVILLGCNEDGITVPLKGLNDGWVVTNIGSASNEHADRPLGASSGDCAVLSGSFTILAGIANYAGVAVSTSAGFSIGDVLEIEDGVGFRFEVTNIPDITHIDVTVSPVPGSNVVFPDQSVICLANCCETLQQEIDCVNQGLRFAITPQLFTQAVTLNGDGVFEVVITPDLVGTITAPTGCPTAQYQFKAFINMAVLPNHDSPGVIMHEVQCVWNSNPVSGRQCFVDYGSDGFDITNTYPPTTENAIWGILQDLTGAYPLMYNATQITIDSLRNSGQSDTISMLYKTVVGQNNPVTPTAVSFYVTGFIDITRIN